jgi:hypothetical protein
MAVAGAGEEPFKTVEAPASGAKSPQMFAAF